MSKYTRNVLISTVLFAGTITINALANILPINSLNTGQVSALYPSLFTPAGFTFSIWSLIYLLLIGFIILHWIKRDAYVFAEISTLFWQSCLLNASWIIAWHYLQLGISLTIMLLLLLCLIQIFLKIRKISLVKASDKLLVRLPFTIYLAWICVATIANVAAVLVHYKWGGFLSATVWTIVMMGVAMALAVFITFKYKTPAFSLVVAWALFGIYSRWSALDNEHIATASFVLLLALGCTTIYQWRKLKFAVV